MRAPASPKPFSFVREELRRAWSDLRGRRASPGRVAAAVALGTFVGCQPFLMGLHLPVVVLLCLHLGLDALVAYAAANISNPLFAPALFSAEVVVGASLREGRLVALDHGLDVRGDPWGSAWAAAGHLALGAPLVGLGLGAVLGAVGWGLAFARRSPSQERPPYRLPESAPAWVKAVERVASRFLAPDSPSPRERTQFHYVRYKLLTDPIARLVVARAERLGGEAPLGDVLDVGAGRGQLALLLVELGLAKRAHGVDWDPRKVSEGLRAASGERTRESSLPLPPLAVTLDAGDARTAKLPPADTVLLIDLLHYFGVPEQDALLARAARAVRAGGRLFVREACSERGWRSWVTRAEEALFTALRWNRGERVCFRSSRELSARLEAEGLTVTVEPAWGKTPFSNVLLVGVRGASPRAPG